MELGLIFIIILNLILVAIGLYVIIRSNEKVLGSALIIIGVVYMSTTMVRSEFRELSKKLDMDCRSTYNIY